MNRNILLLVDNIPVDKIENSSSLSNITVYYLLSNITDSLQPADARIINSFKVCILLILLKIL